MGKKGKWLYLNQGIKDFLKQLSIEEEKTQVKILEDALQEYLKSKKKTSK